VTTERIERRLSDILDEISEPQVPAYLDDILSQTARIRPRPGWTFLERWLPMDITLRARGGPLPLRTLGYLVMLSIAIALAVAALVFLGSRQRRLPAPYGPAANGSIIYERAGDIFVADTQGHAERPLIAGETTDTAPRWSRDGTTIYFGRTLPAGTAVMAADIDGRNVRQASPVLLQTPEAAELSPSSDRVAVIDRGESGRSPRLAVLDLTRDRAVHALDIGTIQPTTYVDWRPPTGDELVFLGHPGGVAADLALYVIRADGAGGPRLLAEQSGESLTNPLTQLSFQGLVLSEDGRLAAYWNWETKLTPNRTCFVHLIDLDTARDRRMTFDRSAVCELGPAFLPDGRILVERGDVAGTSQLLVAPADAATSGSLVGPTYVYRHRLGWTVSPDRREVLLAFDFAPGQLITIETGAVTSTDLSFPDPQSWQRLAP
jgi:WD40 repeat protein